MPEPGKVRPSIGPAPHYRRTGCPTTSEHRRRCGNGIRRSPGRDRRRWLCRRSSSSSPARHRASHAIIESRLMPGRRSMPAGCGGLRRRDCDAAMVACRENITSSIAARTWAPASTDLVICQAIAGANIFPRLLRPGPRQRRRARSRPRQAIDQVRKQPRSNAMLGVDIDYQAIGKTRGSMRLVSVTVRLALHAPPPRGWGRHRRPLSASRLPPRPPAPAAGTISSIRMTSRVCTNCCRCSLSGRAFDRLDLDETNARMPTPGGSTDQIIDAINRVRIDGKPGVQRSASQREPCQRAARSDQYVQIVDILITSSSSPTNRN